MADEAKGAAGEGVDERVKSLEEALSLEKAKNEVLMEQVLKSEDSLAEKDLEGFADVIPNEDREFWRGQFLENREAAVGILNRMRERVAPPRVELRLPRRRLLRCRPQALPTRGGEAPAGRGGGGGPPAKLNREDRNGRRKVRGERSSARGFRPEQESGSGRLPFALKDGSMSRCYETGDIRCWRVRI
jgi:hypothetical protein